MQLTLKYSLPFVVVTLTYRGADVEIPHTLVDTGSAKTMFAADTVAQVGLIPEPQDTLVTVRGVGGAELVFTRVVDRRGALPAGRPLSPGIVEPRWSLELLKAVL